ncbi:MAG TPA: hypothetical protein VGS22_14445, partial [Thermoanaerobaculia bacterium]|nr:hypothetical protein [Thermoanaerobaculia bacterium]
ARMAGFSSGELDLYDRAKIAEQDARGALSLAERLGREEGLREGRTEGLAEGLREGLAEGLREAVRTVCQALDIELDAERESILAGLGAAELKELQAAYCATAAGADARDQLQAANGIVSLHMSWSSTGANSAVAPPKM